MQQNHNSCILFRISVEKRAVKVFLFHQFILLCLSQQVHSWE